MKCTSVVLTNGRNTPAQGEAVQQGEGVALVLQELAFQLLGGVVESNGKP